MHTDKDKKFSTHCLHEVSHSHGRLAVALRVVNSFKLVLLNVLVELLQCKVFAEHQPVVHHH